MLATQTRFGGMWDESEKARDKMTRRLIAGCRIIIKITFQWEWDLLILKDGM